MTDEFINRYTGESKRSSSSYVNRSWHPGPYIGIVKNHLDPTYMGRLQIQLQTKSQTGNTPDEQGEFVTASYLSPFYGTTPYRGTQANPGDQFSQKSYGMWFVPPDIGTEVLVIFAEGGRAFWIGCILQENMNMMLPAADPATNKIESETPTAPDFKAPVGEYNKKLIGADFAQASPNSNLYSKPITDFLGVLTTQGLNKDETRGLTSSSARREAPSAVFGISTPGPYDARPNSPRVTYGKPDNPDTRIPHNRLGGSSLVFDDGDRSLFRTKPAGEAAPEYTADGDTTIPHNEMLRLKTRTGHTILLHNSEDLIYITNSKGTAWVELTSNGKIDIFAEDSISVHSKNDINFKADRDINFEAGRDFNLKANKDIAVESVENYQLIVGKDNKVTTAGKLDINTELDQTVTTGGKLFMNGPEAEKATPLTTWNLPGGETVIMKRVPQHEPWLQHENLNPKFYTPTETDIKKTIGRRGGSIDINPPETASYTSTPDAFS